MNHSWKRWGILALGMAANLAQGVAYAGSVISLPLMIMIGVVGPETTADDPAGMKIVKDHWATIFSLSTMFLPIGMIIAGKIAEKRGTRIPIALGALLYGGGLILASFSRDYTMLCVSMGPLLSVGSGMAYGSIVAGSVRWFPDRRGLASGLVVAALGFGAVVIAPFCSKMLENQFAVSTLLVILGCFALLAMGAASFIPNPPSDFQLAPKTVTENAVETPLAPVAKPLPKPDYRWTGMIRTGEFWVLFTLFFLGTAPGLMVLSQASQMFQKIGSFSPQKAATLVAVLAAANALGRVFWGAVSDSLGRLRTLAVMFVCSAIAMGLLASPLVGNPVCLIVVILLIGSTFGGYLGLFPSFCADSFGPRNMSLNFAILFTAFSTAALLAPLIGARVANAFYLTAALSLLGCFLTFGYMVYLGRKPGR